MYLEYKKMLLHKEVLSEHTIRKSTFEIPEGPMLSHSRGRPGVLSAVGARTRVLEAHPSSFFQLLNLRLSSGGCQGSPKAQTL